MDINGPFSIAMFDLPEAIWQEYDGKYELEDSSLVKRSGLLEIIVMQEKGAKICRKPWNRETDGESVRVERAIWWLPRQTKMISAMSETECRMKKPNGEKLDQRMSDYKHGT